MIVLKIIGIAILSIFALIILALCVKVRIFAEYSEVDTKVLLQWLFIKIPLYLAKKKEKIPVTESERKDSDLDTKSTELNSAECDNVGSDASDVNPPNDELQESSEAETQPKPKSTLLKDIYDSHGIDGLMLLLKRVFSYIGTYVGKLMKSLVIDELYIDIKCTKNDAAETAIYYGEVCSGIFPMLGALVTKYKVRKYDINVYPDFLARHSSASFAVKMHLYPIYLIGITIGLVLRLIFKVLIGFIVKLIKYTKNKNVKKTDNSVSVENK